MILEMRTSVLVDATERTSRRVGRAVISLEKDEAAFRADIQLLREAMRPDHGMVFQESSWSSDAFGRQLTVDWVHKTASGPDDGGIPFTT